MWEIRPKRKYHEIHYQSEQKIEADKLEEETKKRASAATQFNPNQSNLLN